MTMKVRITGASRETYWYADKVGEIFDVEVSPFGKYELPNQTNCIDLQDAEVVTEASPAYGRDEVIQTLIREVDELKTGQRALFKMISRDLPMYGPADLNGKQVTLFTTSDGDYSLIAAKDEDDRLFVISETGACS